MRLLLLFGFILLSQVSGTLTESEDEARRLDQMVVFGGLNQKILDISPRWGWVKNLWFTVGYTHRYYITPRWGWEHVVGRF